MGSGKGKRTPKKSLETLKAKKVLKPKTRPAPAPAPKPTTTKTSVKSTPKRPSRELTGRLFNAELKYKTLVENSPDIIMRFDREGRHLFVSDAIRKVTDRAPEDFLGHTHRELGFPEEHCRLWERAIRSAIDTGSPYEGEFAFEGRKGRFVFNWRVVRETNARGVPATALSIARDITEHRKIERNYRQVFHQMLTGFALHEIILDAEGRPVDYRFLDVNPSFERLTGLRAAEIVGKRLLEVMPETEKYWIETYGSVALTGQSTMYENYSRELGRHFSVVAYCPQPGQFACLFEDITERKKMELTLSESERRYRMLFERASDAIFLVDRKTGRYLHANAAAEALTGRTVEELRRLSTADVTPVGADKRLANLADLMHSEEVGQITYVRPDGTERTALLHAIALGEEVLFGIATDITDWLKAEKELKESRETLAMAQAVAHMGSWSWDLSNNELDWSEATYDIFQFDKAHRPSFQDFADTLHPEDKDRVTAAIDKCFKEKAKFDIRYRVIRRDGQTRHVYVRGLVLFDDMDRAYRMLGMIYDETEQRQAEEAQIHSLKETERLLSELTASRLLTENLIQTANVMIVGLRTDGSIDIFNRASEQITGYAKSEMEGKNWFEVLVPRQRYPHVWQEFQRLSAGGMHSLYENPILTKGGEERFISWSNNEVLVEGKVAGTISFGIDITEKKAAQQRLEEELSLNIALGDLSRSLLMESNLEAIAKYTLDTSRRLTTSAHGYVSVIDPATLNNVGYTLTEMMGSSCIVQGQDKRIEFPLGPDGRYPGLWGHALNLKAPFFTNEPARHPAFKRLPEGHVPIATFLSVPVMLGNELMGQIALCNSSRPYTELDTEALQKLAQLFAIAIYRIRIETRILAALKEKEVLLKEIHHRVKNNMAVISSLLQLQANYVADEKHLEMFKESQSRIRSMAMVHEKLYRSENLATISVREYLGSMVESVKETFAPKRAVEVLLSIEALSLDMDLLIPCGLIINEVLTNVFKHAYASTPAPRLGLSLRAAGEASMVLEVWDNGCGLPEGFDIEGAKTLGLKLVSTLVKQINGKLSVSVGPEGGTLFFIEVPMKVAHTGL